MKRLLIVLLICLILPIHALAQSYGKTGESGYFDGDVGVSSGKAFYVDGKLFDAANTVYPQDYATGAGTSGDPWAGDCLDDAYTACPTGGTIYLRAGYYKQTGSCGIYKSINIIGEGIGRTFIVTDDASGLYIEANYVTLKEFTVDGTSQTGNDDCINADGDYLVFEDIEVKNANRYGIALADNNYGLFLNIYTHDNGTEGFHPSVNTAGDGIHNTYRNVYAWDNGHSGFDDRGMNEIEPNTQTYNIYDNFHAWNNTYCGIAITSQKGCVISNIFVDGNTQHGLYLSEVEDIDVHDCFADLNGQNGFHLDNVDEITLTNITAKNNDALNAGGSGILVQNSTGIKLISCQAYDDRKVTGTDIAFVDGGAGEDTITMTAAEFLKSNFSAGKTITVTGAAQAGNNSTFTIVSVVAGTINVATASLTTETAGASVTITQYLQDYGIETYNALSVFNCDLSPNAVANIHNESDDVITFELVNDDFDLIFGSDSNWLVQYDEGVDDQLIFITTGTTAGAVTDPMFEILVGATPTANQQVFGVAKGTQASNTPLFTVDEDGDVIVTGDFSVTGTYDKVNDADTLDTHDSTYFEVDLSNEAGLYAVLSDVSLFLEDTVDDTSPELGGELDAGAHSIGFTQQTATGDGTTTVNWTLGNKMKFTFGAANETFTFTAPTNPCNILLMLIQDGTGSRLATWPGTVKWAGGTAPTLTTGANTIDICSFYWDGTNYFGVASLAFATP